jgi:hypothetical protein
VCECGYEWKAIKEKVVLGSGVEMEVLSRDAVLINSIKNMPFKKLKMVDEGKLLLAEKVKGYKKGWALNVLKERDNKWHNASWNQSVHHLEEREFELGLTELRKSLK